MVISGYYRKDTRIWHRQISSLLEAGHEIILVTNDGLGCEKNDDVAIYDVGRKNESRFFRIVSASWRFHRIIRKLNLQLVILHSPELLFIPYLSLRNGLSFVYDAHEDMRNHILEKEWLPQILRAPLAKLWSVFEDIMYNDYLQGVISPHKHIIDRYVNSAIHCLEVPNFPLLGPSIGAPEIHKRIDIIYSGTAYYYSNQKVIVEAIQEISNVNSYKIAGYIPDDLLREMSAKDENNKFEFLGRLSLDELGHILSHSKIGIVYYDYRKNLGGKRGSWGTNKVLEYAAAGLPIICTDFEVWKEFIDTHNCGICVAPGDVKALKEAICVLLDNPEKSREMGLRAKQAVEEFYNWSSVEKSFVSFIEGSV